MAPTQVVEAIISEDLSAGLEPDGLGGTGLVQLGDNAAQSSEESPPESKGTTLEMLLGDGRGCGQECYNDDC